MSQQPLQILLVENSRADELLLREFLFEAPDIVYDLGWADSLSAGLESLSSRPCDLILLDLGLPDSAGLATLHRMLTAAPSVPVIVMTGLDDSELAAQAVRQGAQDYLVKGTFDAQLLNRSICYAIERKRVENALRLSGQRYRALFEGSPVPIWQEDFSRIKDRFDQLRAAGVSDFRSYFDLHPQELETLAALVVITEINRTSLDFFGVASKEELLLKLPHYFRAESWPVWREEMIALAAGETFFACEIPICGPQGEKKVVALHLVVVPGQEATLGQVLVSFIDITERQRAEEELRRDRAQIRSYADQLSLLHKVGIALNQEADSEKLLRLVLEGAAEITQAGIGIMLLAEGDDSRLVSLYQAPWSDQRCAPAPLSPNMHRRVETLISGRGSDTLRIADLAAADPPLFFPEDHIPLSGLMISALRNRQGQLHGYFMLSCKRDGASFSDADEEVAALLAAQASVALISAEAFAHEHLVAQTLQSALLPEPPRRRDLEVGIIYSSATSFSRLGGDFYDFIELPGGRLAVVISDVCGKGLEAATATAMVKYTLRAYLGDGADPSECLRQVNAVVSEQMALEKFVTVGLLILDPAARSFKYCSAGHPPPLLIQSGNARVLDRPQAVPLGVAADSRFATIGIDDLGGTTVVLYSDGLTEARPPGGEPFYERRVVQTALHLSDLPAQDIVEALVTAAMRYSRNNLRDDIALIALRLH